MKRYVVGILCLGMLCLAGCKREAPQDGCWETKQEEALEETAVPEPTGEPEATAVPEPTREPEASAVPEPTREPEASAVPEPTREPEATAVPELTKAPQQEKELVIAIDPGHQGKGNYEKEPVGPGATEMKTKVTSGTQGTVSKVAEHQFTLELSLQLKEALLSAGYQVVLTRETADVNISNIERAQIANEAEADIFIRIHADGSDNGAAHGISVLYPSKQNPYIPELSPESERLARSVLDGMCEATGAKSRGIIKRDDLSGTNWAKMPVILVEAGFMTNQEEEAKLLDAAYQARLVQGIAEGVRAYFAE